MSTNVSSVMKHSTQMIKKCMGVTTALDGFIDDVSQQQLWRPLKQKKPKLIIWKVTKSGVTLKHRIYNAWCLACKNFVKMGIPKLCGGN